MSLIQVSDFKITFKCPILYLDRSIQVNDVAVVQDNIQVSHSVSRSVDERHYERHGYPRRNPRHTVVMVTTTRPSPPPTYAPPWNPWTPTAAPPLNPWTVDEIRTDPWNLWDRPLFTAVRTTVHSCAPPVCRREQPWSLNVSLLMMQIVVWEWMNWTGEPLKQGTWCYSSIYLQYMPPCVLCCSSIYLQ